MSYAEEIQRIEDQITLKNRQASELEESAKEWERQSKVACTQTLAKKKAECQADKTMKAQTATARRTQAIDLRKEVEGLESTRKGLLASRAAEDTAKINLSTQGISLSALDKEAQGKADAAVLQAKLMAEAQAEALKTTVATEAENSKNKNLVFILIGVAVAIAIVTAVIIKIRKQKKAQ